MHSVNASGLHFSGSNLNGISTVGIHAPTGVSFALKNDLVVEPGTTIKGASDVDLMALADIVANLVSAPGLANIVFADNQVGQIAAGNILSTQEHTKLFYLAVSDGSIPSKADLVDSIDLSASVASTLTIPLAADTYKVHYYVKSTATTKESPLVESASITVA